MRLTPTWSDTSVPSRREEYEPHLDRGSIVYAGVDYERILRSAEEEADIILWDGGNNDLPFYQPDLHLVVVDPHRPGHELRYHPGEANLRRADVVIINKIDTADPAGVAQSAGKYDRHKPQSNRHRGCFTDLSRGSGNRARPAGVGCRGRAHVDAR